MVMLMREAANHRPGGSGLGDRPLSSAGDGPMLSGQCEQL